MKDLSPYSEKTGNFKHGRISMEQIALFSLLSKPTSPGLGQKKRNTAFPHIPDFFIYRDLPVVLTRKPYQRSIRFHVQSGQTIQVNCSRQSSHKEITSALESHWKWIQKQLLEQQALKRKYPLKKFREGESFLFQGRKLTLKYEKIPPCKSKNEGQMSIKNDNLIYCWSHPENLNRGALKKSLLSFYKKEGKKQLQESLSLFSSRMQLFPKSVRMGSQKSLWGSCSSKGTISLNWRLIAASSAILNYVVIHELAHLRYLNHSLAFWSLVSRFCPEYKKCEYWLRHNAYAMDFLLPRSELHDGNTL